MSTSTSVNYAEASPQPGEVGELDLYIVHILDDVAGQIPPAATTYGQSTVANERIDTRKSS
jgi:hypothetical protein